MKTVAILALIVCASLTPALAQEKEKPLKLDKETVDKGKELLEKALGEVKNAAGKGEDAARELWARSKDSLRLSREEYLKKATSGLKSMEAEISVIAESGSAVMSREYFQTRVAALKQHLDYCKRDLERLQTADSEEAFRVKQKGFDRGLGFLGDNIEMAQEEAGL
jgi:hypothetical protein